jgi:hypothetical protein
VETAPFALGGGVEAPKLKNATKTDQFLCSGNQIEHFLHVK